VRSALIVLPPPSLGNLLGLTPRDEPMGIQARLPKGAVERFHVRIVRGLAGPREIDPHAVLISPPMLSPLVVPGSGAFLQPVEGARASAIAAQDSWKDVLLKVILQKVQVKELLLLWRKCHYSFARLRYSAISNFRSSAPRDMTLSCRLFTSLSCRLIPTCVFSKTQRVLRPNSSTDCPIPGFSRVISACRTMQAAILTRNRCRERALGKACVGPLMVARTSVCLGRWPWWPIEVTEGDPRGDVLLVSALRRLTCINEFLRTQHTLEKMRLA